MFDFIRMLQQMSQQQEPSQPIPVPNDFGQGGMMMMDPRMMRAQGQQAMQMRPPMQAGPEPPVDGRSIAMMLRGMR